VNCDPAAKIGDISDIRLRIVHGPDGLYEQGNGCGTCTRGRVARWAPIATKNNYARTSQVSWNSRGGT
jgi:hypothetical protein